MIAARVPAPVSLVACFAHIRSAQAGPVQLEPRVCLVYIEVYCSFLEGRGGGADAAEWFGHYKTPPLPAYADGGGCWLITMQISLHLCDGQRTLNSALLSRADLGSNERDNIGEASQLADHVTSSGPVPHTDKVLAKIVGGVCGCVRADHCVVHYDGPLPRCLPPPIAICSGQNFDQICPRAHTLLSPWQVRRHLLSPSQLQAQLIKVKV